MTIFQVIYNAFLLAESEDDKIGILNMVMSNCKLKNLIRSDIRIHPQIWQWLIMSIQGREQAKPKNDPGYSYR